MKYKKWLTPVKLPTKFFKLSTVYREVEVSPGVKIS